MADARRLEELNNPFEIDEIAGMVGMRDGTRGTSERSRRTSRTPRRHSFRSRFNYLLVVVCFLTAFLIIFGLGRFSLFTSVTDSSSSSTTTTSLANHPAETSSACVGQLIPGLDRLAHGVDITQYDPYHDYSVDAHDGFKARLFDWHCSLKKTWKSPNDNVVYLVPDEIDGVFAISSGLTFSQSDIIEKTSDLRKAFNRDVTTSGGWLLGSYSSAQTFETLQNQLDTQNTTIVENKAHVNMHKISLMPAHVVALSIDHTLSAAFNIFLNDVLPNELNNETIWMFERFFSQMGTHSVKDGVLGGTFTYLTCVSSDLVKANGRDYVLSNSRSSFLWFLKNHGAPTNVTERVDTLFESHSNHTERYYGGNPKMFAKNGFNDWLPTVAHNPWLHTGVLEPITNLLPDDHPKKRPLIDAQQIYLARSYLRELSRSVTKHRDNPPSQQHIIILNVLGSQVDKAIASPLPSLVQVKRLRARLNRLLRTPANEVYYLYANFEDQRVHHRTNYDNGLVFVSSSRNGPATQHTGIEDGKISNRPATNDDVSTQSSWNDDDDDEFQLPDYEYDESDY